jgi:hypothetical protein
VSPNPHSLSAIRHINRMLLQSSYIPRRCTAERYCELLNSISHVDSVESAHGHRAEISHNIHDCGEIFGVRPCQIAATTSFKVRDMINMKNEARSARIRVLYASAAAALLGACTQTTPAQTATTMRAHSSGPSSDMQEVVVTASRDQPVSRR